MTTPTDHTYDLTLRIRSPRPYTRAELEKLSNYWLFIQDRQITVTKAEITTKGGTRSER